MCILLSLFTFFFFFWGQIPTCDICQIKGMRCFKAFKMHRQTAVQGLMPVYNVLFFVGYEFVCTPHAHSNNHSFISLNQLDKWKMMSPSIYSNFRDLKCLAIWFQSPLTCNDAGAENWREKDELLPSHRRRWVCRIAGGCSGGGVQGNRKPELEPQARVHGPSNSGPAARGARRLSPHFSSGHLQRQWTAQKQRLIQCHLLSISCRWLK